MKVFDERQIQLFAAMKALGFNTRECARVLNKDTSTLNRQWRNNAAGVRDTADSMRSIIKAEVCEVRLIDMPF